MINMKGDVAKNVSAILFIEFLGFSVCDTLVMKFKYLFFKQNNTLVISAT